MGYCQHILLPSSECSSYDTSYVIHALYRLLPKLTDFLAISVRMPRGGTALLAQLVKNLPAMWETPVWSLGWEDPLGEGMATLSSVLASRTPSTEEPGGYGPWWQRVRHKQVTAHSSTDSEKHPTLLCFLILFLKVYLHHYKKIIFLKISNAKNWMLCLTQ